MTINLDIFDANGNPLNIGDRVAIYNWGVNDHRHRGDAEIYFNSDEGRIDIDPPLVEDAYDLVTKALPRCEKIG